MKLTKVIEVLQQIYRERGDLDVVDPDYFDPMVSVKANCVILSEYRAPDQMKDDHAIG